MPHVALTRPLHHTEHVSHLLTEMDLAAQSFQRSEIKPPAAQQLKLYLGPELIKTA